MNLNDKSYLKLMLNMRAAQISFQAPGAFMLAHEHIKKCGQNGRATRQPHHLHMPVKHFMFEHMMHYK